MKSSSGARATTPGTFLDRRPTFTIRPTRGWVAVDWMELWRYRELLYFLVWRDMKVRYKQSVIGAGWAIIQPVLAMVVFTIVLGRLVGVPSDGVPYPVFAFCALLPWQLFSRALTETSNSLVGNQSLVTKVYFPRLLLPAASVISGLVDFAISFVVLVALMLYFGIVPGVAVVALPLLLLLCTSAALGIGLFLCALNVEYRDVRYAVPFLVQIWMFATPVVYPSSLIPADFRWVMGLNPMAGIIEGFRWALLGTPPPGSMLLLSAATSVLTLIVGIAYFRRVERTFPDVI